MTNATLRDLVKETEELQIDGRWFCAEEALLTYDTLPAEAQRALDDMAAIVGSHAVIELIYIRFFPNYFVKEACNG